MRVLLAVVLVGIVGCGGDDNSPDGVAVPPSPAVTPVKAEAGAPQSKADKSPAQAAVDDPVAALKKLGAIAIRNDNGEIQVVNSNPKRNVTDPR